MSHTLRVVCRPSSCDGFALAGVRSLAAANASEATAVLQELVAQAEPGVVFIEESLYRGLPAALRDGLERRALPIVVPFPEPREGARSSAENELVEMLRTAIGHRVRLR